MKSTLRSVMIRAVLLVLVGSVSLAFGQNAVPFVNLPLVPGAVTPGSAAFTLTVNGTGFVNGSTVSWNGSPRATTFVSSSKLTASILATDVATVGTAIVTVSSPTPGGGLSNFALFEITTPVTALGFTRSDWAVGNSPSAIVAGNFDGNATLDLAVTNENDNTVSILLNNGNGTFQTHVDYATGTAPSAVAVGDFNGDGILDLAVANYTANTVSVLLGNGNGTFQEHQDFSTGAGTQNPAWLAVGDFNRDGKLDLAVANEAGNTISILLGNGNGTFTLMKSSPVVASGPVSVAVGDLNGDGILDLVVASFTGDSVSVLLGNGDGTFKTGTVLADIHTGAHSVAVADFNNDGILDFAIGEETSGTTSLAFGKGNGTFQPLTGYSTGSGPTVEIGADLNGDGFLDLVTSNFNVQSTFTYLLSNGDGTFQFHINYGTGSGPLGLTVGDFNNDGMLDLAVAASSENTTGAVTIMTQVPPLTPSAASLTFLNTPVEVTSAGQNLIITDNLSKSVVINSIVTSGPFAETGTCKSIGTLASCTLNVTFTPTAMGTQMGTITITDNAIATPVVVNLTGNGIAQAQVTPASYAFGDVTIGNQATKVFTLQNNLSTAITISSIVVTDASGEFSQQSTTCGTRLAAKNKCTITVAFTPAKAGTVNGAVTVTDSAYGTTQKSTFTGVGVN